MFSTTAILADVNPTTAKNEATTAKSDPHNRHIGGDYKPSTKPSTKEKLFSKEEEQEKKWYLDNPMANIREEHKYLFFDNQ